jgi:hypothetical protein
LLAEQKAHQAQRENDHAAHIESLNKTHHSAIQAKINEIERNEKKFQAGLAIKEAAYKDSTKIM